MSLNTPSEPTAPEPTGARAVGCHPAVTLVGLARWVALGAASGLLAGLASWVFLTALNQATTARLDHGWLIWLLPAAGLTVGGAYHYLGGRSSEGNALLLDQIHEPTAWIPRRMAPLVGVGTVVSHLFGASVGREGTALQMSGSLTDWLARRLGLRQADRRILLTAALGGGFGAVFGVPLAGAVFGLEVQRVSWHGHRSGTRPVLFAGFRDGTWIHRVTATLTASWVGDRVVRGLGYRQPVFTRLHIGVDPAVLGRAAVAGVAFGLTSIVFVEATDLVRSLSRRAISWAPARPAIGAVLVLGAVALVGRDYLGLSLPLAEAALSGSHTDLQVPFLKLAFTALCLGAGFVGGEVTPLFIIGATLGSAIAPTLGLSPVVGAAIGFVAVFAGAANTPIACMVMGYELFGTGAVPPVVVACVVAYLCSGRRGIYPTQRRTVGTGRVAVSELPDPGQRLAARRRRPRFHPGF